MANTAICSECFRDEGEENTAEFWCCQCSEPICKNCARYHRKSSPFHDIVSNQAEVNTLSSQLLKFSTNCSKHSKKKLNMFCCMHEEIVCGDCIFESHIKCQPVMTIEKASKNVKESSLYEGIIRRMGNMYDTVKEVIANFEKGLFDLDKRKKDVRKEISTFRKELILYMDEIEDKLITNLEKEYQGSKVSLSRGKSDLSPKLNTLQTFRSDIQNISDRSTNTHIFRVLKYLDVKMHEEEQDIKNIIDKTSLPNIQFQKSSTDIKDKLSSLVRITVVKKRITLQNKVNLYQQGQTHLRPKERQKKPTLLSSFESKRLVENSLIERACFVPDNKLLFLNTNQNKTLILCNLDGSESREISIEHTANSIAAYDKDRALVATPKGVMIINMNVRRRGTSEELVLHPGIFCWAVATIDGKVVVYMDVRTISITDISGRNIKQMPISFHAYDLALDVRDNIYLSACNNDRLYVITSKSEEHVIYESSHLRGNIAVDVTGNVLVSENGSHNVYKLSSNKEYPEVILSADDGLCYPKVLACNKDRNELLIINTTKHVIQIYKM